MAATYISKFKSTLSNHLLFLQDLSKLPHFMFDVLQLLLQ